MSTGLSANSMKSSSDEHLLALREKLARYKQLQARIATADRAEIRRKYPTPGALAKAFMPATRQTPALDAIDASLVDVADAPGNTGRQMIFIPPQEGKSTRTSCWFPLWMLAQDPTLRIAIVSYSQAKAIRWGRWIRRMIEAHPELGIELMTDSRAVDRFETTMGGVVLSVGIDGGITSEAVDLLVIDDPIRGRAEAESSTYRENAWAWWESNGSTRGSSRFKVVLMMCMTGDTPVLLPDGTEKSLRDVRAGDRVATYENGRLSESVVMKWSNQGPDDLFRIKMKSGRSVRANARHPFLTIDADGKETWLRTDQILPGTRILTAIGGNGAESHARSTSAAGLLAARECATPTTAKLAGRQAYVRPQPTQRPTAAPASSTATASPMRRSISSSLSRAEDAPFAASRPLTPTPALIGTASFALTMITTPAGYADSSATTAISPSGTGKRQQPSEQPLTTWNVTPDEVIAVESCGREDVYDLTIDRTENFIANGLVSHNTRWHADDLAGRLIKKEPGEWSVLRIPAVRDEDMPEVRGSDGASAYNPHGELISVQRRAPGYFLGLKAKRSLYVWNSIYKQTPVAAEGNLFARSDFRYWQYLDPDRSRHDALRGARISVNGLPLFLADMTRFITVDLAASKKTSADYTVASAWAISGAGELILLDRRRGRFGEAEHWDMVKPLTVRWACPDVYVEQSFITATFVRDATKAGMRIQPLTPDTDKITRSIPAANRVRAHTVRWPDYVDWLDEWEDEIAGFPMWAHDDQADTLFFAARIASAHVTLPAQAAGPLTRERLARAFTPADQAYEAATGLRDGAVDLSRADW